VNYTQTPIEIIIFAKNLEAMKKTLFSLVIVLGLGTVMNGQGIELFISEYVEGWSNNKALELYNPTATAIDLSNYRLDRYSNGSTSAAGNQKLVLEGTIEPYSTFVIVLDKRDPEGEGQEAPVWEELQEKADAFFCPVYDDNNVMYFNGNDFLALVNISGGGAGFIVDSFGRAGQDPQGASELVEGWNNIPPYTWQEGVESWTKDKSLIRKPNVEIGDFDVLDIFDPSVEWDSIPPVIIGEDGFLVGNWSTLGWHDCDCAPLSISEDQLVQAKVYPNPTGAAQEVTINTELVLTSVVLYDITGKVVWSESVPAMQQYTVSINNLEKGIYLIQGSDGVRSFTQKMVKN